MSTPLHAFITTIKPLHIHNGYKVHFRYIQSTQSSQAQTNFVQS